MTTIVVLRAINKKEQRTVRFATDNAPVLLIGDTFVLPFMVDFGAATVMGRHWSGQKLVLFCKTSHFLIADLVKKATKMKCCVDDYELPDQDWSQPFEE